MRNKKLVFIILALTFTSFIFFSCSKENTSSDNEPPTVAITYPANSSEFVQGTVVNITAEATDNEEVDKVEFYVDGSNVSTDNYEPYKYEWDTADILETHTVYAKAYDTNDNTKTSEVITINIIAGNQNPSIPYNPNPAMNATSISIHTCLTWDCFDPEGDSLNYDVYFGNTIDPPLVNSGQTERIYNPGNLFQATDYYWKINAHDDHSNSATGEVWQFTTEEFLDWQWAIGGESASGENIAVDQFGNTYVTGSGDLSLIPNGGGGIFVVKFDAQGNVIWATSADGGYGESITIDNAGNAYVTGYFGGTANFGSYSITSSGGMDIFVAKVNQNGNWQWAKKAGGNGVNGGLSISIDNAGNTYVTGSFMGTANFGSYSITSSGAGDAFVAKMDVQGNWLWAESYISGMARCILTDNAGNSYITGRFGDCFVAKIDANGNWQWEESVETGYAHGYGIAPDESDNLYITGLFEGLTTFGPFSLTCNGITDIFVAKMDASRNWQWAIKGSGNNFEFGNSITVDDYGNGYITGRFSGEVNFGEYSITGSGGYNIFVAKVSANGDWQWVYGSGGWGKGISLDDMDNLYITGNIYGSCNFGSFNLTNYNMFVVKASLTDNTFNAR